jgi:hypothetical protein
LGILTFKKRWRGEKIGKKRIETWLYRGKFKRTSTTETGICFSGSTNNIQDPRVRLTYIAGLVTRVTWRCDKEKKSRRYL